MEDDGDDDEHRDKVEELPKDEPLRSYLLKLNSKLEQMMMPVAHRLESFQRADALLTSIRNNIPQDSYLKIICDVE